MDAAQEARIDGIVAELKTLDRASVQRVFKGLEKELVFNSCPWWTCSIKQHYHINAGD